MEVFAPASSLIVWCEILSCSICRNNSLISFPLIASDAHHIHTARELFIHKMHPWFYTLILLSFIQMDMVIGLALAISKFFNMPRGCKSETSRNKKPICIAYKIWYSWHEQKVKHSQWIRNLTVDYFYCLFHVNYELFRNQFTVQIKMLFSSSYWQ